MVRMRICYDYQVFATQKYGGISRYFVELASRIHQYAGAEVRVISPLYRSKFLVEKSTAIPVFGIHCAGDFRGATRVIRRLDSASSRLLSATFRPDIVHETYYSRNRTSSASTKTVVTVYDTIEELFPEYFPMSKKTVEIRKSVYSRVDHVICISENTRKDLIKIYGVNQEKVSVVHLASSIVAPIESSVAIGGPFFLYVGDRGGYKNFSGLLAAFAESFLYKTHKLVCFGGGPLKATEQTRMSQLGIPSGQVLFVGGDDTLLASYYATADAFIYPSLYEGFGIPLLEAMQCGCPVLCSNNSSIPEVAGDAAIYFDATDPKDISDAMKKVVQTSEERNRLITRGKLRVKQFSWDICAQQTFAVYERLLTKK
jgi:glycosyltransferase involved in cell wall biosynthesis